MGSPNVMTHHWLHMFAILLTYSNLNWSNPILIRSQEMKLGCGLPQTVCGRSLFPPVKSSKHLKLLTFFCLDNQDGLCHLPVFLLQLSPFNVFKKKNLATRLSLLFIVICRMGDLKIPSSHLLQTGMSLDSQREPNDSISSLFEPIVEKAIGCLCWCCSRVGVLAAGLKCFTNSSVTRKQPETNAPRQNVTAWVGNIGETSKNSILQHSLEKFWNLARMSPSLQNSSGCVQANTCSKIVFFAICCQNIWFVVAVGCQKYFNNHNIRFLK